jgi:preprotein translocase subunit SecE
LFPDEEVIAPVATFFYELVRVGVYKRNQGRITRQVTFAAVVGVIALGLLRLGTILVGQRPEYQFGLPLLLLALGVWASYRLVNVPAFADFLIAVEAEMNKVSWPTRGELFRASMVVLILIFVLAFVLAGYDMFWKVLLFWLGVGVT